jgi:multidrug efflux pump subunit AcrA (membrane-fusion protein)
LGLVVSVDGERHFLHRVSQAENAKAASEIRALKVQLSRSEAALEEATRKTPFLQQLKAETATIRKQAKAEAEQQLQQAANIARTSKLEVDVLIRVAGTEWEALELVRSPSRCRPR